MTLEWLAGGKACHTLLAQHVAEKVQAHPPVTAQRDFGEYVPLLGVPSEMG